MILGHAFLAFTFVTVVAYWRGFDSEKALSLGVFSAFFAFIPDLDILLAFVQVSTLFSSGTSVFVDSFWQASSSFHRGISHSLVTGLLATILFTAFFCFRRNLLAVPVFLSMFLYGLYFSGIPGAFVLGLLSILGLLASVKARDFMDIEGFMLISGFGLLSHPFGDVFTGTPPDFLYPFGLKLFEARLILNQDPVLNLLSIFFVEVSLAASSVFLAEKLTRESILESLSPVTLLGCIYGLSFFLFPAPSLEVSYRFVYSLLGVSIFVTSLIFMLSDYSRGLDLEKFLFFSANLVATTFIGMISYLLVFLVF